MSDPGKTSNNITSNVTVQENEEECVERLEPDSSIMEGTGAIVHDTSNEYTTLDTLLNNNETSNTTNTTTEALIPNNVDNSKHDEISLITTPPSGSVKGRESPNKGSKPRSFFSPRNKSSRSTNSNNPIIGLFSLSPGLCTRSQVVNTASSYKNLDVSSVRKRKEPPLPRASKDSSKSTTTTNTSSIIESTINTNTNTVTNINTTNTNSNTDVTSINNASDINNNETTGGPDGQETNVAVAPTGTTTIIVPPIIVTTRALDFIAQEKAMVIATKRASNHHNLSKIWHLDIARDADLPREIKAKLVDKAFGELYVGVKKIQSKVEATWWTSPLYDMFQTSQHTIS
jgi:hypothetical protein